MKNKENYVIKEIKDNTDSVKKSYFVPICLSLIVILLFGILFKLHETNKYLKTVSECYNSGKISIVTTDENYESVSDVFSKNEGEYNSYKEPESSSQTNDGTNTENNEQVNDGTPTNTYVLNTSSKKIHKPECSFVDRTKEENKKTVELNETQLNEYKNDGYTMCSTCGGK